MCGICSQLGINLHRGSELSSSVPVFDTSYLSTKAPPFLLEDYAGLATWTGKPIYNQQQVIGQLDMGRKQDTSDGVITFAFFNHTHALGLNNNKSFGEGAGYTPFSEGQKDAARDSVVFWDDLIAAKIVEVTPGPGASSWGKKGQVDIWLANTVTGPGQAWAYGPGYENQYARVAGDAWIAAPEANWSNDWLSFGGYGLTTLVHELGHSLGLSHPGDYDAGDDDDNDGVADPITYEADAFYAQDTKQYTIMSYFRDQKSGGQAVDVSLALLSNPQTPLLHDILAIQDKYGADPNTRKTDTIYFANSNAGNAVYDLQANPFPYLAVYDAGGEDTFDFTTANTGVFIDLRPGSFSSATAGYESLAVANAKSAAFDALVPGTDDDLGLWTEAGYAAWVNTIMSIGANRVNADTGVAGITATSHRNISIAYNTIIENANGGSARDYLHGNDVSNKLSGNGGNDVLDGSKGNDIYTGGTGADEFRISEIGFNDELIDFTSGLDKIGLSGIDANAGVAGNQAFTFLGAAAFTGTAGQLRTYSQNGDNFIAGDVNGDGIADFTININGSTVVGADIFL